LPQGEFLARVRSPRQRAVPLLDNSRRRVHRDDLDFLPDCRGQRKADLPQRSVPDVQVELMVYVQLATVQTHKRQRFRRHLGRFRAHVQPATDSRAVLITVLQSSPRSGSSSTVRPVGGHWLQIVGQLRHQQLDVRRGLDQQRAFQLVGTGQSQFGQRNVGEAFVALQPAIRVPLGRQGNLKRLAGNQRLGKFESDHLQRCIRSRIRNRIDAAPRRRFPLHALARRQQGSDFPFARQEHFNIKERRVTRFDRDAAPQHKSGSIHLDQRRHRRLQGPAPCCHAQRQAEVLVPK